MLKGANLPSTYSNRTRAVDLTKLIKVADESLSISQTRTKRLGNIGHEGKLHPCHHLTTTHTCMAKENGASARGKKKQNR